MKKLIFVGLLTIIITRAFAQLPVIVNASIPNTSMQIGDIVTATITVGSSAETFVLVPSTIGGYSLYNLVKLNNTTYTAQFIIPNGGSDIASGSGIPVNIILNGIAGNSAAFTTAISQCCDPIDVNAPTVTSVSSTLPNGSYGVGQIIPITVTFSEPVTVSTGIPKITLETGTTDRIIDYSSGSGTNTLTFNYTVQTGDITADLDYVANSLIADPLHKSNITNGTGGALLNGPTKLFVSGNYAYVASELNNALEIIDVSNPSIPVHTGSITGLTGANSVFVKDNYAYVTSAGEDALEIVDVSNPASPVNAGRISNGTSLNNVRFVYVSGNYAYVAGSSGSLAIVNVSDPLNPVLAGSIIDGAQLNGARYVQVVDNYAYLACMGGNRLVIVDVNDPMNPVQVGSLLNGVGGALLNGAYALYVLGNYAYVASSGSNALEIVNVSNPASPVHAGSLTNGTGGAILATPHSVYVSGNFAYVASNNGGNALEIVNVSNPASPVHAGSVTNNPPSGALLDFATSVQVFNNYAYVVSYNSDALEIIDVGPIRDAANNRAILTLPTPGAAGSLGANKNLSIGTGIPTITSFTPTSGPVGTPVTITGTNFSTTPSSNIVFFGATQATVTAATATSLTVTVPVGATYQPITVLTNGLLAYSSKFFLITFSGVPVIDATTFPAKLDYGTGTSPYAISIGDLDGDGKADLAVANRNSNTLSVLRNTSTPGTVSYATKVDFATGNGPNSISMGDVDGDGKLDLALANYVGNTISVLRNTSIGPGLISFTANVEYATGTSPRSISLDDIDGDGRTDLSVVNEANNTASVFRNTGTGPGAISYAARVNFATGSTPVSLSIGDLDGDVKADLVVANDGTNTISILRNISTPGAVSFAAMTNYATGVGPRSISIGDVDGDGKADLAVPNVDANTVSVLRNTSIGPGSIGYSTKIDYATGSEPYFVSMGDLDGDSKVEMAVANRVSNTLSVLRNTSVGAGSVSYAGKFDYITGTQPWSVSIGDLDGDGKSDLCVTNAGSNTVSVFRNNFGPSVVNVSSSTANGSYGVGAVIPITVTFNIAVNVIGTPTITLETGTTDRAVNYTSGTGTNTLIFNYTVQAGDVSADLEYLNTTALSLNGGSIKDASDNDAILTLPSLGAGNSLGESKAIVIDGIAPPAPSIPDLATADDIGLSNSDNITSNDASLTLTGTAEDGALITFTELGIGVLGSVTATGGNYSFDFDIGSGTYNITATAQDAAGNFSPATAALTITVDTGNPMVTINQGGGQSDPTSSVPMTFDVVFSEAINPATFTAVDIAIGGTATGVTVASLTTANNINWGLTITATGPGTISPTLSANLVQDIAGNTNGASTSTDNSVTYNPDTTPPTVTITSTATEPTAVSPIPVTITFSENVTGFILADISVTNGTAGSFVAVNATTYTASITPTAAGVVTVTVNAGVATDAAANGNTVSNILSRTYTPADTTPPTVTITSAATEPTAVSPIPVTITFSENVTGFILADISVTNGTAGSFVAVNATTYTASITPAAAGVVTVTVNAAVATDAAANGNTVSNILSRTYTPADTTPPTVTITSAATEPTAVSPIPVTITFSENVTGFILADISVTNGTAGSFVAVNATTYTASITPAAAGVVTVTVNAGVATDAAANGNTVSNILSRTYTPADTTPPTVTITSTATEPTAVSPIPVTITFSENVTGFILADISVTNGTAGSFVAVNATTYTASITPAAAGVVTVTVNAGVATDAAANGNTVSNILSRTYTPADTTPPTVTITSTATEPTAVSPIPVTITFSENVTGFILADISVTNGTAGSFVAVNATTYTASITPAAAGVVTVTVNAGVATDAATNGNTVSNILSRTYTPVTDTTPPTVTITSTATEPTAVSPIPVTITFSENVTGFILADISVTNGTAGSFVAVNATTYTASITPAAAGVVTVTVNAGVATDAATNGNTVSNILSRTYTPVDTTPPTVTITSTATEPTAVSPIPVTITFSENVTGFILADISVTNGTAGSFVAVNATTYTASITPAAAGVVTVTVNAGVATDAAANGNTVSNILSRTYEDLPAEELIINSFITPNTADDQNNVLFIQNIEFFPENNVKLMDRWGVQIKSWTNFVNYRSTDAEQADFDFSSLSVGNYICIVEYITSADGNKKSQTQMISVLK